MIRVSKQYKEFAESKGVFFFSICTEMTSKQFFAAQSHLYKAIKQEELARW